jgi:hypothetical protein
MSEEAAAGLAAEVEADAGQEVEHQSEPQEQSKPSAEDVARQSGWRPLEEFEGEPAEWRSAEVFNERGDWIKRAKAQDKRMNDLESDFNTRLENSNKLHQHQMELQKDELIRKRDDAIDDADRETANKYQDDIDKINTQPEPAAPANNNKQTLDNWNASNSWIMGSDPKAAFGKQQFANYQGQGMTIEQSISAMESDVNRAFPDLNTNRDNHPLPEKGSKPGRKAAARSLTMADLTSEERKFRAAMPGAWKDDKEFLQAVSDSRSEK